MTGVGTDSPRDLAEFVTDTRRRLVSLERRQVDTGISGGHRLGETVTGVLEAGYVGPGPARVKVNGETALSGPYEWAGSWQINGNRTVTLVWNGTTWQITGHSGLEGQGGKLDLFPLLVNNWTTYNIANGLPDDRYTRPRAQRLPSGIVVLSGLIGYGATAQGTTLFTLPEMYRPDTPMIFPINNGDQPRTIIVNSNGNVSVEGGNWIANTYISLDGIAYPAKGVAAWTSVGAAGSGSAFQNGWGPYFPATWGPPRYWKDPYGIVWFAGLVGGGTNLGDNYQMFSLPTSHQAHLQSHVKASSGSGFGFVSGIPGAGQGISWKTGTATATWVSLGGVTQVTTDGLNNNAWKPLGLVNGWKNYNTSTYPAAAALRREDGLTMTKGLVNSTTAPVPSKIAIPRGENGPAMSALLAAVSAAAWARLDLYSAQWSADDDRGHIRAVSGSNAWLSLDGQMWMTGD